MLTAIQRFSTLQGYMPSVRELGRELGGLAPATVQHHLAMLKKKGYLEHDGAAHGMRLAHRGTSPGESAPAGEEKTPAAAPTEDAVGGLQVVVPLLGSIAAGRPLEAVEESDEYVPVPASLVKGSSFVLRVTGESMIEDGILDGDLIVVQSCEKVENGQAAVALLPDGTATLKRVHAETVEVDGESRPRVRLQPANSSMEPF
ncbi:MAG: transcriptional repressor LexA, partial [Acidobacteriota bacterium]